MSNKSRQIKKRVSAHNQKLLSELLKNLRTKQTTVVIVACAIVGAVALLISHAATPVTTIEAEKGITTGGSVNVYPSSTASANNYVKFGVQPVISGSPVLKVGTGSNADKFVDGTNKPILLHGVNRGGLEFGCSQQNTFTPDGNTGAIHGTMLGYADVMANSFKSWEVNGNTSKAINTVRIPLNEECWLGISGAPANYSGGKYQQFIKTLVDDLTAQGKYVILDLHWSAPGNILPGVVDRGGQDVAPNADHSIDLWRSVAIAYKGYSNVAFDLYNEPHLGCNSGGNCPYTQGSAQGDAWSWGIYRDGGAYKVTSSDWPAGCTKIGACGINSEQSPNGTTINIAGIKTLIQTIRGQQAHNVVMVEGPGLGTGVKDWAKYMTVDASGSPVDPDGQMAASQHEYDGSITVAHLQTLEFDLCQGTVTGDGSLTGDTCVNGTNIMGRYPFYIGEIGTSNQNSSTDQYVPNGLKWAAAHNAAITVWDFEQWAGPSLITNDESGAVTPYGGVVKSYMQANY